MTALFFVDSNVLIYCYDSAAPGKQSRASLWMEIVAAAQEGVVVVNPFMEAPSASI